MELVGGLIYKHTYESGPVFPAADMIFFGGIPTLFQLNLANVLPSRHRNMSLAFFEHFENSCSGD